MNYEKAFKHPEKKFEVRYAIRMMKENNMPEAILKMTTLNISGGKLPQHTIFPTEAVKKEFNADWGATVNTLVGEEFGQDYKYCLLVYIHKNGFGDAYTFYLADDTDLLQEEMLPIFRNFKFK